MKTVNKVKNFINTVTRIKELERGIVSALNILYPIYMHKKCLEEDEQIVTAIGDLERALGRGEKVVGPWQRP